MNNKNFFVDTFYEELKKSNLKLGDVCRKNFNNTLQNINKTLNKIIFAQVLNEKEKQIVQNIEYWIIENQKKLLNKFFDHHYSTYYRHLKTTLNNQFMCFASFFEILKVELIIKPISLCFVSP